MVNDYPKTMKRGPFKGRTFDTAAEYVKALDDAKAAGTVQPRGRKQTLSQNANGVTKAMAKSLVQYANIVLTIIPQTREDALDEVEVEALTLGILDTARSNRFFANLIVKTCQMQSGSRLAFAGAAIVARRVARREILPLETRLPLEMGATMLLSMLAQDIPVPTTEHATETTPDIVSQNGHSDIPPVEITDPFSVAAR